MKIRHAGGWGGSGRLHSPRSLHGYGDAVMYPHSAGGGLGLVSNPVMELFEHLTDGRLGDTSLPFPILITAFRRQRLMDACMAPRNSEEQQ